MKLSSRSWIKSTFKKNYNVFFVMILNIKENVLNLSFKFVKMVVVVVKVFCFLMHGSVIKNDFWCFWLSFSSISNFFVKIIRHWDSWKFRNCVSWNSPRLHSNNPIINWESSFLLFKLFLKSVSLSCVCVFISIVLHFDNWVEWLVFFELTKYSFKI